MFKFGYMVPKDVPAYWGARAILETRSSDTKQWYVDLVYDRQSMTGNAKDTAELAAWLNSGVLKKALAYADELLRAYKLPKNSMHEYVFYGDEKGTIYGSPNGSYGYLYLTAHFHSDENNNGKI